MPIPFWAALRGIVRLSLGQDTSVSGIAAFLETLSPHTGVHAEPSPTSVRLFTKDIGYREFVRVTVLHAGGVEGPNVGFYTMEANDAGTPDPESRAAFFDGAQVCDSGAEPIVSINGAAAEVRGTTLLLNSRAVGVEMILDQQQGGTLGEFRAFTIRRHH